MKRYLSAPFFVAAVLSATPALAAEVDSLGGLTGNVGLGSGIVTCASNSICADIGTSGATIGLLNANKTDGGNNIWTGGSTFSTPFGVINGGTASVSVASLLASNLSSGNFAEIDFGKSTGGSYMAGTLGYVYNSTGANSFTYLSNFGDGGSSCIGLCVHAGGAVSIGSTTTASTLDVRGTVTASATAGGAVGFQSSIGGAVVSSFSTDMSGPYTYIDYYRNVFFRDVNAGYTPRFQITSPGVIAASAYPNCGAGLTTNSSGVFGCAPSDAVPLSNYGTFDCAGATSSSAAVVSAYGAGNTVLFPINCTIKLSSTATWPAGKTYIIPCGTSLVPDAGVTITVKGTVQADHVCQIFFNATGAGAGAIIGMRQARPEWWGALNDNSHNDQPAIMSAIGAISASADSDGQRPTLILSAKNAGSACYKVGNMVSISPTASFQPAIVGSGTVNTPSQFCAASSFPDATVLQINGLSGGGPVDFRLRDFAVKCNDQTINGITFGSAGVQLNGFQDNLMEGLYVAGCGGSGYVFQYARQINLQRSSVWMPDLTNANGIFINNDDATGTLFTSDLRFSDVQVVPSNSASGQIGIWMRVGASGVSGLAGLNFDRVVVYPPTNSGYHIRMDADTHNISDVWFSKGQIEGAFGHGIQANTTGTGQIYDVHLTDNYFQGIVDGVVLNAANADKIYDWTIIGSFFRGVANQSLVATNTNNIVFANNVITSAPSSSEIVKFTNSVGANLTGNSGNAQGGGSSTFYVSLTGTTQSTGCANNRMYSIAGTFVSNSASGTNNDCASVASGGVANRP